jgi:hypothetical protein
MMMTAVSPRPGLIAWANHDPMSERSVALLCARRERRGDRRAAKQHDELASS